MTQLASSRTAALVSISSHPMRLRARWMLIGMAVSALIAGTAQAELPVGTAQGAPKSPVRTLADSKVALHNGAFSSDIAIEVPAFHKVTPSLSLSYNSSAGNGFVGVGWDLQGFSTIERASPGRGSPRHGLAWTSDTYLMDGEELVPSTALGGSFATKRQQFLRIKRADSPWLELDRLDPVEGHQRRLQR